MSSTVGPADTSATEFVLEEFETTVSESVVDDLAERITEIVRDLRSEVVSDDRLEELLRGDPGPDILHGTDLTEHGDPEPFTQRTVIEPLFDALGYPDFTTEASGLTDEQRQKADYLFSLREYDDIDSDRLPVEAEPINKKLDQQKHGIGQVKDWLDTYSFGAEFGIATDGMRWTLIKYDRERYQYDTLAEVNLQPVFIAAFENVTGRQVSLDEWLEKSNEDLLDGFVRSFGFENFRAIASDARSVIKETKSEITDEFYDEYVRRVFGVVEEGEERTAFSLIENGIEAPESATGDDIRLFAVELMNRLIFIKFLEDRELVPKTLLADLAETYNPKTYPQSLYETYFEPLFFGVLDERPSERSQQIRNVEFYSEVPYLNGGLFRPHENTERGFTDEDFNVGDAVLTSLVDFLEGYNFSADGGPNDLDPSVLGNVFEKTINYLTNDSGDAKKELGAYYTPDEITRFCAEETVRPWLLERFKTTMIEDLGRKQVDMDRYDDVFELIERAVPQDANVINPLLDDIDQFHALDPACGSGHFLTSILGEIVAVRKALHEKHPEQPQTWELQKRTVVENIYGVDIVEPAVEITKLRLWLSIIAEVNADEIADYDEDDLALPNVVFNVQHGNSLIGYTDLMETSSDDNQMRIDAWGPDTVRTKYEKVIEEVRLHKEAQDTDTAREHLQEAERLRESYRTDLNERVLEEFKEAGIEAITLEQIREYQPFHWVLEFAAVYADGGFDVITGNPPWDMLTANRAEFFSRYDPEFRSYPASERDEIEANLLDDPTIAESYEQYQQAMEYQTEYFNDSPSYQLQSPSVGGRSIASENDLSALFLERIFALTGEECWTSLVLPGVIFNGAASKDLREQLLDSSNIQKLFEFENHGIFEDLHPQYQFGVLVFNNLGDTDALNGIFRQRDLSILEHPHESTVEIPRQVLESYSPNARIFPFVTSQTEVDTLNEILSHPSVAEPIEGAWQANPLTKELHEPSDKERFVEDPSEGEYPVYGGANIHQYHYDNALDIDIDSPTYWSVGEENLESSAKYRIREKRFNRGDLKRALYDAFEGNKTSKSQKQFVNDLLEDHRGEPLSMDDILLDCDSYRIGYRDIARASDERTMIATILPPDVVCLHTLQTLRPNEIVPHRDNLEQSPLHDAYQPAFTDRELFVTVGFLNSIAFDFLMRTKVDSHIVLYKMEESQIPRLTKGDDWFEYIWQRAARLNCYGEAFAEMRERLGGIDPATEQSERERLRAEIDAAAFHAYGLGREETQFILDDFHRVQNPRLMTEDYFDRVLDEYDALVEGEATTH
ncbi:Eco57I restriction-modification methylase domain-containing protein [Halococcus thailandensis]|uniref:site-specific DNA-methyltransferase (adenine-specific) n=1 Tax=Halococcus thailandensis JCM 13552 TaxID=1227457 RepID=M0NDQ2_9EURY|nr:DNA methyltransferase [Halococcus thailandensis]EMA55219.1 hypothetical protein C451_05588 [Halococcus thailandensis JCM 13552]